MENQQDHPPPQGTVQYKLNVESRTWFLNSNRNAIRGRPSLNTVSLFQMFKKSMPELAPSSKATDIRPRDPQP